MFYFLSISGLRAATMYSVGVSASRGSGGGGVAALSVRTASAPPGAPPGNVTAAPAGATVSIM